MPYLGKKINEINQINLTICTENKHVANCVLSMSDRR